MSAQAAPGWMVHYCPVCGPCLKAVVQTDDGEAGYVTIHRDIQHPYDMIFDEEEHPQ